MPEEKNTPGLRREKVRTITSTKMQFKIRKNVESYLMGGDSVEAQLIWTTYLQVTQ